MADPATGTRAKPRVHSIRSLTESTYVLRFDRNGMAFEPGQYVSVGITGDIDRREYSIYSGSDDDYLEILVKEIDSGSVSKRLRRLGPGDEVESDGPFGFFVIDSDVISHGSVLFIATGTGISPFHCFARSCAGLDYQLVHGVRTFDERYDHDEFDSRRVVTCASREHDTSVPGVVAGRVTDYLREISLQPEIRCYLCGNCDMIYESFDILKGRGVPPEHLFAEVYF